MRWAAPSRSSNCPFFMAQKNAMRPIIPNRSAMGI
jgi:hypothetical protein